MNGLRMRSFLSLLMLVLATSGCARPPPAKIVIDNDDFADLQQVQIFRADSDATQTAPVVKGIALLLGTEADWHDGSTQLATRLAASGWLVAGIHIDNFVSARKAQNADCLELVTLLDVFSQHLQQRYRIANYQRPLLVGYRQGGSIAYLTLAQAATGIFRGAVSLGLDTRVALPLPYCDHDGASTRTLSATQQQLVPVPRVAARWSVWSKSINESPQKKFLQAMNGATLHAENISHDDDIDDWLPAALTDIEPQNTNSVDDLPLVEMPAPNSSADYFAVVLSGDGGWANIDRDIGNALNARGINVVGWNSLQYFWNRRTPESAAADLIQVLQHYRTQWQKPRVLLIGYSLGADVLPFMLSRMPQTDVSNIASVVLLSVSTSVDFEFHVSNWIDVDNNQAQKTLPELEKISALPVQCFYGSDDDDSACRSFKAPPHWHIVELPGDHHFDGDYEKVTTLLLTNAGIGTK